jgi:hypothetical protein
LSTMADMLQRSISLYWQPGEETIRPVTTR